MKRFHIHVGVKDLEKSVQFYSTLFGQNPSKRKTDYAKWMLENPKVNFAISTRTASEGVDHLGIQVESESELAEISERLKKAEITIHDEGETTCCYTKSNKAWVSDPTGIAWEAYQNMGDVEVFSAKSEKSEGGAPSAEAECCVPSASVGKCC